MLDRLTALDASFLYLEQPSMATHVGSVMILQGDEAAPPLDHEGFARLVEERIGVDSRYRQRVRELPGRISGPVWVDDADFEIDYHVRHSALPSPGTDEQLAEFVARIQSRPLDREHPLWEIYVVEGLSGGRVAVVTKTHQSLVDGVTAVDIGHLLLDDRPQTSVPDPPAWSPRREPGEFELVTEALIDAARRPLGLIERVRGGVVDSATGVARRTVGGLGALVAQAARTAAGPASTTALNTRIRAPRRFRMLRTDLEAYRQVRDAMARSDRPVDVSVTDVALTVLTGGLRTWLQSRGEPVHSATTVRAMVPVSVTDRHLEEGASGSTMPSDQVVACFVDLPVGEPNTRVRLESIAYQTRHQVRASRAVPARTLAGVGGFAPATLHHMGARVTNAVSRRMFDLVITNVPGPQRPLFVGGRRMLETYPVMPLTAGLALAIGLTSYDGELFIGLNADRSAMTDLGILADGVLGALEEVRSSVSGVEREA